MARAAWITLGLVVFVAVAFELADFFGQPLLDSQTVQSVATRLGIREPSPEEPFSDLSQIHLVSRDLRSHPAREGFLQLTATIVNRAARAQPYPQPEVILADPGSEAVGFELNFL